MNLADAVAWWVSPESGDIFAWAFSSMADLLTSVKRHRNKDTVLFNRDAVGPGATIARSTFFREEYDKTCAALGNR